MLTQFVINVIMTQNMRQIYSSIFSFIIGLQYVGAISLRQKVSFARLQKICQSV